MRTRIKAYTMVVRDRGKAALRVILCQGIALGLILQCLPAAAQPDTTAGNLAFHVSGIIRDAQSHEPLGAAQIRALNNEVSATAGEDGQFSIDLSSGNEVLLVTSFDHNPREIPVRGQQDLVIDLYPHTYAIP